MDNKDTQKDLLFLVTFFLLIIGISVFNFVVDPYNIFKTFTIKGLNDNKIHSFTNKRTVLYSDIKLNHKGKDTAFVGNCLLYEPKEKIKNVAFYSIPMVKPEEILQEIKNINKIAPNIKKIYLSIFFDELWNEKDTEITNNLPELESKKLTYKDFINLLFSWNTTKYSIETIMESLLNKDSDTQYVYPYREIAKKEYNTGFSLDILEKLKDIKKFANENNIEIIILYSPMHITKKAHIYLKNQWNNNQEFKRQLAVISPFYDYSIDNKYNKYPLDEHSIYYIDNVHMTPLFNELVLNDVLSEKKEIGVYINKENIENYLIQDTKMLEKYIEQNPKIVSELINLKREDANFKIEKSKN